MSDERTPLIATVRVGEPRQRYTHHVVRRFCTIAMTSCLIGLFTTFLVVFFIDPPHHRRHGDGWPWKSSQAGHKGDSLTHDEIMEILFETPSAKMAEDWSRYYTAGPHLAGKNLSQVSDKQTHRSHAGFFAYNAGIGAMDSGEVDRMGSAFGHCCLRNVSELSG